MSKHLPNKKIVYSPCLVNIINLLNITQALLPYNKISKILWKVGLSIFLIENMSFFFNKIKIVCQ